MHGIADFLGVCMDKRASSKSVTVLTCVRDARKQGGGIAAVALPVHQGLRLRDPQARLLCGLPAQEPLAGQQCMTASGQGFASLSAEPMPAVVHVHGLWTSFEWRACAYARRSGLPLVMSPHGMLEPWALAHKKTKKWLAWHLYQRRLLARADLLVVNSWNEYRTMRRMGLKAPVAVIENGVETHGSDHLVARSDTRKSVLFLSRLCPVKGIFDLLEAWARLPSGHGYDLRIYGQAEPGYAQQVAAAIERLGLGASVALKGPVFGADKWQAFRNADLFVLPSYSENFGIVVAESLLTGLPVITTRATPWECLESEGLGWLVENDPGQLADALQQAMSLPEARRQQMGVRGADYAQRHFLWPAIIDKYVETYAWIAGLQSRRPSWVREE